MRCDGCGSADIQHDATDGTAICMTCDKPLEGDVVVVPAGSQKAARAPPSKSRTPPPAERKMGGSLSAAAAAEDEEEEDEEEKEQPSKGPAAPKPAHIRGRTFNFQLHKVDYDGKRAWAAKASYVELQKELVELGQPATGSHDVLKNCFFQLLTAQNGPPGPPSAAAAAAQEQLRPDPADVARAKAYSNVKSEMTLGMAVDRPEEGGGLPAHDVDVVQAIHAQATAEAEDAATVVRQQTVVEQQALFASAQQSAVAYHIAQEATSQNRQIREATLKLATQGPSDPEAGAATAEHHAAVLARMPDAAMLEKRKAVDEATAEVLQGMVKRQKEADAERQRLATFTVRLAARMLTFRAQASS